MRGAKPTIGWREWVSLPGLGIKRVKAKVDTGARSSSLHAFDVEVLPRGRVEFKVHPIQDDSKTTIVCQAPLHDQRLVRSSDGRAQLRPVIRVEMEALGEIWEIDVTLTSRDLMGFRMLLGREAIRGRFLVDPGRSFLLKKLARKR